jgi:hypothetical protein
MSAYDPKRKSPPTPKQGSPPDPANARGSSYHRIADHVEMRDPRGEQEEENRIRSLTTMP